MEIKEQASHPPSLVYTWLRDRRGHFLYGAPGVNHESLALRRVFWNFTGGAVDKNLPASARDTGLIPGLGRFHIS